MRKLHEWLNASCPFQRWLCSFLPACLLFGSSPSRLRRMGVLAQHAWLGTQLVFAGTDVCGFAAFSCAILQQVAASAARAWLCCVLQAARVGVPFNSAQIMTCASATVLRRANSSSALKQRYMLCWWGEDHLHVQKRVALLCECGAIAGFSRLSSAASLREELGAKPRVNVQLSIDFWCCSVA